MIFASFLLGYLCGSVPFGLILTKLAGLGDIRAIGSGNIGATNVLRTGNKKLAALVLVLDAVKGVVPVGLVLLLPVFSEDAPRAAVIAGLGAILGHMFPVWLKFKGGKGVATTLGVLLAVNWQLGVLTSLTWLGVGMISRISSLAALLAIGFAPVYACFFLTGREVPFILLIAALVWIRHHQNIRRLVAGTEPRIGEGKNAA